jgi:hypothetical protein
LECLQRYFLWDGPGGDPKIQLVNWNTVCDPVSREGLGIKKLMVFNKALLGKWLWRFGHEEHSLWRQEIWCSVETRGSYGVSLWRFIRNGWGTFSNFLSYKVGDGSLISFWHDVWCGIEPLKLSFPELYSIARNKEASVSNYLDLSSSYIHWNPSFTRDAHDWELETFESFFNLLYSSKTHMGEVDSLLWTPSRSHMLTVKSFYSLL